MATATALFPSTPTTDVPLGQFDPNKVYDTKYVSVNPMVSDWQPKDAFGQEVTAFPKLGLTADHGYIIRLVWRQRATVSMRDGFEISEEQAERFESTTGRALPRFNAFDCYVDELIKTDGPARRERLQRTYEQQKEEDQSSMFKAFEKMFGGLTAMIKGEPPKFDRADMVAIMENMAKESPDKFNAILELVKDGIEGQQDAAQSKKPGGAVVFGDKRK